MQAIVIRISIGLMILTTTLALLGGVMGRLLPRGESLFVSLPGNAMMSAIYLFYVEHRLPYLIDELERLLGIHIDLDMNSLKITRRDATA